MSYWLYCPSCQKWSKSAMPMSADKSCSFCGELYAAAKSAIDSHADLEIAEKLRKPQQDTTLAETRIKDLKPKKEEKNAELESSSPPEIAKQVEKPDNIEQRALTGVEEVEISQEDEQEEIGEDVQKKIEGEIRESEQEKTGESEQKKTGESGQEKTGESEQKKIGESGQEKIRESEQGEIEEDLELAEKGKSAEVEEDSELADISTEEEEAENGVPEAAEKPKMTRTREKYLEKKRRSKNSPYA